MKPFLLAGVFSVALMILDTGMAFGQSFPNKPIRMVTEEPGGVNDFMARLIAQGLSPALGQPVIVENLPGVRSSETVSKAPPDGYTLLVIGGSLWIGSLMRKAPYDPVKDFSPITTVASTPQVIVVSPSAPVNSVKELIALAKSKPGALNYASTNLGGSSHLATELFKSMTGTDIVRIAYKGTSQALNALLGGSEVQLAIFAAGAVAPHVKAGKMKALAVTSAGPSSLAPGLPTVAATVPGYESVSVYGLFAPAKMPNALVTQLNTEIVRTLKHPDVQEKFLNAGLEEGGSSPEAFAARVKSDIARWGKVIKDGGISEMSDK